MPYIIDANNLAGKLSLLKEKNFDKKLIKIIADFNQSKTRHYILVFDGYDQMGEKFNIGNIKIVYTPHDSYYKNADDKMIEIIEEEPGNNFTIVTDDNELKERVVKLNENRKNKVKQMQATAFANIINTYFNSLNKAEDDEELSKNEQDNINDELMRIWK